MAKRPVFVAKAVWPFCEVIETQFTFFNGFAISQKQKSVKSLHDSFKKAFPMEVLEISTKSTEELGARLSAFNLTTDMGDREISLECAFQGSKCFENGGPYKDIYEMTPLEAKKDPRLKESGNLIGFELHGTHFSNEPKDFFYNWIYSKALFEHKEYLQELLKYGAFTDIEFNPARMLNCQAKAVATVVGLIRAGLLEACMADQSVFLEKVYRIEQKERYEQLSFF